MSTSDNLEYQKVYRQKNKDKAKLYRQKHKKELVIYQARYQKEYKEKNYEKINAYQNEYRKKKKHQNKEKNNSKYKECRDFQNTVKNYYGCVNPLCQWVGNFTTAMLDFHHIDASDKKLHVTQCHTIRAACREINKCCVLCANCHREKTFGNLNTVGFLKCKVTEDRKIG